MMLSTLRTAWFPLSLLVAALLFAGCDSNNMQGDTMVDFDRATYQVSEGADGVEIQVVASEAAPQDVTIPLTLGGTAIAGEDYEQPDAAEVTIEEGSTTGTFTLRPIDNASLETQARVVEVLIETGNVDGFTVGETPQTDVTITDDEMTGSYTVSFEESSYTANEYEQDTLDVIVNVSQAVPSPVQVAFETTGSATTDNYELLTGTINVAAGQDRDTIQVAIKNTESYGESETLTLSLTPPANEAVSIGGTTEATIEIVNPVASTETYAPNEDFARLWAYNTFSDIAVPETGRLNRDQDAGVVFEESFAFTLYPSRTDGSADPNVFGFGSPLWSEDNFTRNTNILNMVEFYSGGGPGTVDEGVSSASAGLYYPAFFRLTPDAPGSATGTITLIPEEIVVYRPDQTDDGVDNPTSFTIGVSSEGGTYNETEGTINITITFDETEVNNGTVTRRFEFSAERRPSS